MNWKQTIENASIESIKYDSDCPDHYIQTLLTLSRVFKAVFDTTYSSSQYSKFSPLLIERLSL